MRPQYRQLFNIVSTPVPRHKKEPPQSTAQNFLIYFCKTLDLYVRICYTIVRKEVKALSKKKKSGNKVEPASYITLVTAIINLIISLILLYEKITR